MSDERVIEYLRDRGRVGVPIGFVSSVMSALDEAPAARSWFGFSLPVVAGVAVAGAAIALVLALVLGPGRPVGPVPSAAPSATTSAESIDELRTELQAAIGALRAAPGVQGLQTATLRDILGGAVWFDWRSNGDYVLVQRTDLDVTQTGWWLDPAGEPPVMGERVGTIIWAFVADRFFFASGLSSEGPGSWQDFPRSEAPPVVAYGPGLLSGEIEATDLLAGVVIGVPDLSTGTIERRLDADGRVTWTAETPWRGGTATQRWGIAPDGSLRSWTWDIVGATLDPDGAFDGNMTSASLQFDVLGDPAPIVEPDLADVPDPVAFGLPDDFPLAAPAASGSPAPAAVVTDNATCAHPSGTYSVTLPDGWWTNATYQHPQLGELAACRFFGPAPFDLAAATPEEFIPDGVSLTIDYLDGGCVGSIYPMLSSRDVEVDGWAGSAAEFAQGTEGTDPAGSYEYVINLRPDVDCEVGSFIVGRTDIDMAGDYEANKVVLDEIMASMEITFTAP